MPTAQPALNGEWPALAMMKRDYEAMYKLLLRLKRGN